jgi:acetylornithine deacetylase/succinyl-diaminopimelate desuccinylase-like protein
MLGDITFDTTGNTVVRRVLSTDPLTIETSFESRGKVLGTDTTGFGTYTSTVRPDGSIVADGQGTLMTQGGDMVTYKGSALGQFKEKGAASHRGIFYFQTKSQTFARLNAVPSVFETEVDPEGHFVSKGWEWK